MICISRMNNTVIIITENLAEKLPMGIIAVTMVTYALVSSYNYDSSAEEPGLEEGLLEDLVEHGVAVSW